MNGIEIKVLPNMKENTFALAGKYQVVLVDLTAGKMIVRDLPIIDINIPDHGEKD